MAVTQPHPVISLRPRTSRQWQLLAPCGQPHPGNVRLVLNFVRGQPHPDPTSLEGSGWCHGYCVASVITEDFFKC